LQLSKWELIEQMGPLFTDQRAVAQYTGKRPFGRLPFFPLSFRFNFFIRYKDYYAPLL
jgi:hypothetical protein